MKYILLVGFILSSLISLAQSSLTAPLNDVNHYLHDRMEIKTGDFGNVHSVLKPLMRKDIRQYQDRVVAKDYWTTNNRRQSDYDYVQIDYNDDDSTIQSKQPFLKALYPNGDKSFLRHFYRTPAHLLEVRTKNFYANVNPILHFKGSLEQYNGSSRLLFLNRRGAAIRGNILNRVYFY
jgi:hypothetical protein